MEENQTAGKIILFSVLGLVLAAAFLFALIEIGKRQSQPRIKPTSEMAATTAIPKTTISPTVATTTVFEETVSPTSLLTTDWKTHIIGDNLALFRYPPSWEIVSEVPEEFREKIGLIQSCTGPMLQNTQVKSTMIAVEIIGPESQDGAFCWSSGVFRESHTRVISTLLPPKTIAVSRWMKESYYDPTEGVTKITPWEGDLFQQFQLDTFSEERRNRPLVIFALLHHAEKDSNTELTFDQILSTFKFLN